jgi:hypothetical protein
MPLATTKPILLAFNQWKRREGPISDNTLRSLDVILFPEVNSRAMGMTKT